MTSAPPVTSNRDAALTAIVRALRERNYRFITVTPATHARVNGRASNTWARSIEDIFGWSRPFRADDLPEGWFALLQQADVVRPHGDGWRATVRVSTLDDTAYLHSAFPTATADAVFFGPDTYRFAAAIAAHLASGRPVKRAVDIGCGAGPGAIVVALARPDAEVFAIDINAQALRFATLNASIAGAANVVVRHSDLLSQVDGLFDLIVANPPYLLDRDQRTYRHGGGRLGEGLSLAIADLAATRLAPGGTLLLYTGSVICDGIDGFRAAIAERLADVPVTWTYRETDPDVFGEELAEPAYRKADRIATVVLTIVRPN